MTKKTIDNITDYTTLIFLTIYVFAEIFTWDSSRLTAQSYHYWIISILGFMHLMGNSQKMVNKNQFTPYYFFALICIALGLLKKYISGDNFPDVILTSSPLAYMLLLHISLKLLFPLYPNMKRRFVIISFSKYGATWDGKNSGYQPDKKESLLSAISFFGTIIYFAILIIFFVCK